MSHAEFVHLRVHSAYSLSEGALRIGALAEMCRARAMPAVAIADTGNLFGAFEFSQACARAGIQPIIGCQVALARPETPDEEAGMGAQRRGAPPEPDQLVLLVQNETGYRNLIDLVSTAFLDTPSGEAPRLPLDRLIGRTEGLLALTGGPAGTVGRLLAEGHADAARGVAQRLAALFPGRLYVELMRHGLEVESRIEPGLIALADEFDLPLVATNEAFFADSGMAEAHDALICIAEGAYVNQGERRRVTPEHRFKDAAEMRALFADLPEAVENTLAVARRCAFMVEERAPILPAFPAQAGHSELDELRAQAEAGLDRRLAEPGILPGDLDGEARDHRLRGYRERLDYELGVIADMGYPGYFLIVAEFIQWAKAEGIPVGPGRGSGAGSVVSWALTITDLDPLRFGLLFERFLNPERVSMPDFDIDFCQERRDEVIRHVQRKYGTDRVAQIITFGKLQARAVLRDVGRVLEMPYGQVDRICKLVPNNPANPVSLAQAIQGEPQLQAMRDHEPEVARLIDMGLKLEGLYRHASTHAAGVVIGDRPLRELVPLYRDPRSDMPVTQFNMKAVEAVGLVKFDFLGLKTLSVLARAVELARARDIDIDLAALPLEDPTTFEMLGRGDSTGVFQLESSGMRDVLRKLKPDRFEDIIALVALYRPGPMDNIPRYIACKRGDEEPDYLDPALEDILKETFGVMIYQEQVMQIAQVLSSFSLGKADILRRAMGKKIKSEMDEQRTAFVDGAVARGVAEGRASNIFDQVAKFAGYGFNKSHAAAYALVAYQTAYLKAHHPVEFLAASMTFDMQNTDKLNNFRQELRRLGFAVLPPDINRSRADFSVEYDADGEGAVRYALAAVKNVGVQAMAALVEEREAGGAFADLFDFAGRVDARVVNKRQLENLVRAGAFDSLNPNRAQCFAAVETMIRHASVTAREREAGQSNLFGGGPDGAGAPPRLPDTAEWAAMERLREEFDAVGFYLSAHPLEGYGKALDRLGVVPSGRIEARMEAGGSSRLTLAGIMVGKQERTSTKGNRFAFVQLSDTGGLLEVTMFSELLASARDLLEPGTPILVTADARLEEGVARLTGQSVRSLDEAAREAEAGLRLIFSGAPPVDGLRALFQGPESGRGRVSLVVPLANNRRAEVALPGHYAVTPNMRAAAAQLSNISEVEDI
ncbi:MAG: DNA polymerase III subunit alpha [Alphaproteobacteria bacterium]